MLDFLTRNGLFVSSVILLVASLQLVSSSIKNPALAKTGEAAVYRVLSPVQEARSKSMVGVRSLWEEYVWLRGVAKENEDLKEQITRLERANAELRESDQENERLRKLLDFSKSIDRSAITAGVIARDPSSWNRSLTVNKGAADGVKEGQAVTDGKAAVGVVTSVTENSARVSLITNSTSAVDALTQRTRAAGIVESNSFDQLVLSYLVKREDIAVGDRIVTSGLDAVFPKGILIGIVTHVRDNPSGLFQRVTLEPAARLPKLETVMVLRAGTELKEPEPLVEEEETKEGGVAEEETGEAA